MTKTTVQLAVKTFLDRQERSEHPDGYFDKSKRWYPSETEKQECCNEIRNPSATYPYSLMKHCRSKDHVMNLFPEIDRKEFNKELNSQKLVRRVIEKLHPVSC